MSLISNNQSSSLSIDNILPTFFTSIETEIPSNTPYYTQNFSNVISLNPNNFNYISNITFVIDAFGVNNILEDETLIVTTNNIAYTTPSDATKAYRVVFRKGYYTLDDILSRINKGVVTYPLITINTTNTYAYRTILNYYPIIQNRPRQGVALDFSSAPSLQRILGFIYPRRLNINTISNSTDIYRKLQSNRYILSYTNVTVGAPTLINLQLDYSVMCVTCDLINQSNLVTQEYIAILKVKRDSNLFYQFNCNIPITKYNFSNINWKLTTTNGKPFFINTVMDIFTIISSQNKKYK